MPPTKWWRDPVGLVFHGLTFTGLAMITLFPLLACLTEVDLAVMVFPVIPATGRPLLDPIHSDHSGNYTNGVHRLLISSLSHNGPSQFPEMYYQLEELESKESPNKSLSW